MSLLDRAKNVHLDQTRMSNIGSDEVEAAIAWLQGEVAWKQLQKASGKSTVPLHIWLREAYRLGFIKVTK